MSTLNIIIKQEYFDEILSGDKKTEYREAKDFWTSRLYNEKGKPRKYDTILFRAGYDPGVPEMLVEFNGFKKVGNLYHIKLGKILSHKDKVKKPKRTGKRAIPATKSITNNHSEADVYIQYHNADVLGYPFTKNGKDFTYDKDTEDQLSFFTRKISVLKAIGTTCFLILGETKQKKEYYLWCTINIEKVKKEEDEYIASGKGIKMKKVVRLNDIPGFDDFKKFCGNFGIGFQKINNHPFHKQLSALADKHK